MTNITSATGKNTFNGKIIYCSGPLFCPGERGEMLAMARRLEENGYETFLPQRDGIEALVMGMIDSPLNVNLLNIRKALDRAIFALDMYQILERCDALVLNMNGRVPDEGALVEAAAAWTAGKPLVVFKDDARTAFKGMDNSMVSGLIRGKKITTLEAVPGEVARVLRKSPAWSEGEGPLTMPADVEKNVSLGRNIWKLLSKRRAVGRKGEALVKEIAAMCR